MLLLLLSFLLADGQAPTQFEAEDANLTGVLISTSGSGYSGSGYVSGFDQDGDQVEFSFGSEGGLFELIIGYATPFGEKGYELSVNQVKSTGMFPSTSGSFSEIRAGKYLLQEGENSIIIGKGWGWYFLDYVRLEPAQIELPRKPAKSLIDSRAIPSSRALMSYLVDIYGRKILSGQQDMSEIEYVESKTGKTPAVGAFDLIDYSPSRIEFGANPTGSVENWIDWAESGRGIISLCWHWNAPTDLINEPGGKEWWRGFYTEATTFDFAAALANPGSERYQLILRDLDAIAQELKKLQDSDIPVLWRPLHEASGGWFWWGAQGPDPFKKLWQLMVDRFTNYHELHNLIWVYTHGDSDWYPGDQFVDIVSLDVYTDPSSNMSGEWESVQSEFNGRKLVALSESGILPVPERVRTFGTWWSWFAVWNGEFIRGADLNVLEDVYTDEDILTLDELPDWRRNAEQLYFAQFADGLGLSSQIVITNDDETRETKVYIMPRDNEGQPLTVDLNGEEITGELEAALPPGGMRVFSTDGEGPLSVGSVSISSTGPVSGVLIFAGPGLGLAGVGNSVALQTGFKSPVMTNSQKGVRTGVAVMNLEEEPVNCGFELIGPAGVEIAESDGSLIRGGSVAAPLAGGGHFSIFAEELVWTPSVDFSNLEGTVVLNCSGRTAATAIQVRPGQFATLPVTPR